MNENEELEETFFVDGLGNCYRYIQVFGGKILLLPSENKYMISDRKSSMPAPTMTYSYHCHHEPVVK